MEGFSYGEFTKELQEVGIRARVESDGENVTCELTCADNGTTIAVITRDSLMSCFAGLMGCFAKDVKRIKTEN